MKLHLIGLRILVLVLSAVSLSMHAQVSVPYVGCPGDGQTGPYAAARGSSKSVNLQPEIADKLAWYEYKGDAGQIGTLGPRGWNCFVTIGSNGESLYVAPEALDSAKLVDHKNWKGFTGPAIQLSSADGGTSGRFEVARTVARVFPAYRNYARRIIAEGFGPSSDYPFGPFRSDHLTYRSKKLVEFTTPSRHKGLGTMSWLLPSISPSSASPCLASEVTSTRNFCNWTCGFRTRFHFSLPISSSKPRRMAHAECDCSDEYRKVVVVGKFGSLHSKVRRRWSGDSHFSRCPA